MEALLGRWRMIPSTTRNSLRLTSIAHLQPTASTTTGKCLFHTARTLLARKKERQKKDLRVTLIRYHLQHPLTPRPLRFSRTRALRHWTIHRAYQLFRSKQRQHRELELERQFNSMRDACEALRLIGEDGLAIREHGNAIPPPGARDPQSVDVEIVTSIQFTKQPSRNEQGKARQEQKQDKSRLTTLNLVAAAEGQKEIGRLYRSAMTKTGVWAGVPIEYARTQTETPPRNGWDHGWTR